jgi:hypothetical protein
MSVHLQASKYKARLAKQAIYQADHRERMRTARRPERPALADGLLTALVASMARTNTTVASEIKRKGLIWSCLRELRTKYDPLQAADALQRLIDRERQCQLTEARQAAHEAAEDAKSKEEVA